MGKKNPPKSVKMPQAQPELKKYLDKRLFVQLNGSRKVIGVLRGYDVFLNIVLDDAVEEKDGGEKVRLGMVVIRGNSVVMLEALERTEGTEAPTIKTRKLSISRGPRSRIREVKSRCCYWNHGVCEKGRQGRLDKYHLTYGKSQ